MTKSLFTYSSILLLLTLFVRCGKFSATPGELGGLVVAMQGLSGGAGSGGSGAGITVVESSGTTAVVEGGGDDSYSVSLNSVPESPVTVTVSFDDSQIQLEGGTSPLTLVFSDTAAQTITVSSVDDSLIEGMHSSSIRHSVSSIDVNYNGFSLSDISVSITDNDAAGIVVSESGGMTSVTEGGATDTFSVVLSFAPTADVAIAISPDSQVSVSPSSLTFTPANWDTARSVTVSAVDDSVVEGAHTGLISQTVSSVDANYNGFSLSDISVSIIDNDVSSYTIGGIIAGLSGSGLVLQNNLGDDLSATVDGAFTFSTLVSDGGSYNVTVASQPTSPAQTCTVSSGSGTVSGASVGSVVVNCMDNVSPDVSVVSSLDAATIRVFFSKDVTGVGTASIKIVDSVSGLCSDNSDFSSSSQTADFTISSVSGSNSIYDITITGAQTVNKTYTLVADKSAIQEDKANPNYLGCPNTGSFLGLESLKISDAECSDETSLIITFSKPVLTALNADSSGACSSIAECAKRYSITGSTDTGNITSVQQLNGTRCNGAASDPTGTRFCVTHTSNQNGGQYTIIGANDTDGDGFDNAGCGWGTSCAIRDSTDTEDLQSSPNDRASFSGCGAIPGDLGSGPISSNPYADSSSFGYLTAYGSKIYIGPNEKGNSAARFDPDGTNPHVISFTLEKDTTGSTSSNTATTRDGGIGVPPFVSIGFTSCTVNTADLDTSCGPNNEDGRGVFTTGTIGGQEYLFISGSRSAGQNDYLYFTSDTDSILDFHYIDLDDPIGTVTGNLGMESIYVFNQRVYINMPGNKGYRPYIVKMNDLTQDSVDGVNSVFMDFRHMWGIGPFATKSNKADIIGGTFFSFNDRVYLANNGSVKDITNGDYDCPTGSTSGTSPACSNDGGVVRSLNNDPGKCTSANTCSDWVDIAPVASEYTNYFSISLRSLSELIPADRPIPGFVEYNGNLFFIRNACTTNMIDATCTSTGGSTCSDDVSCTVAGGTEVPQLWKCSPGGDTHCDSGDWSLVDDQAIAGCIDDSDDLTNFGNINNSHITLLAENGGYLYVGLDNALDGVEIYRTNVLDPECEGDFTQVGTSGLGDATSRQQIFDSVSVSDGFYDYLYISAGKGGSPVSVFVQKE